MTQQQNLHFLVENLTKTQQKNLYEKKQQAILYNGLYREIYAANKKNINFWDPQNKLEIITRVCNHSPHLYNETLTLAYLQKIYIKTCNDFTQEQKRAEKFEQEHAETIHIDSIDNPKKLTSNETIFIVKVLLTIAIFSTFTLYILFNT